MIRVLHVGDLGLKQYGKLPNTFERKIVYGLLRNEFCTYEFSDKDIAKSEAPLGISRLGDKRVNQRLLQTVDNFRPQLLILSNAGKISNDTLQQIRERHRHIRIACYTCDPLFSAENRAHQVMRLAACDALYVTMAGPLLTELATLSDTPVYYLPNPTDPSVEYLNNYDNDQLPDDLLFCGTGGEELPRTRLVKRLRDELPEIRFQIHGILGNKKIIGYEYFAALSRTAMALNINKEEQPLYSSDRLSQLMGNGILCFIHQDSQLQTFFGDQGAVFFSDYDDLKARVSQLAHDKQRQRDMARTGAEYYRRHFSSTQVARFMVETAMQQALSPGYVWPTDAF